jgi:hypothetical protein
MAQRRLTAALTAAAALAFLVLGASPAAARSVAGAVRANAQLTPANVEFGDRLTAEVVAVVDATHVDPGAIQITERLAPLTQLGPTERRIVRNGLMAAVVVTTPVACSTDACLDPTGERTIHLAPARLTVPGATVKSLSWPVLMVAGRVSRSDIAAGALRADATPPPLKYRISGSLLAWLLAGVSVALAVLAAALVAREVTRVIAARRAPRRETLAHALELAREAENRSVPDRRRALGLLARRLGGRHVATSVRDLAWSAREPSSTDVASLVEEIEHQRRAGQ